MSSAIDEAMARFTFAGSGPEANANYHGCQPYQSSRGPPAVTSGGFRGGPQPPIPGEDFKRPHAPNNAPVDPQHILAQILATKNNNRPVDMGGSSSNNSSSSRTGVKSSNRNNHSQTNTAEPCDMTLQSEYENVVRSPIKLARDEGTGEDSQATAAAAAAGKARRRLGRQESRYTSGKLLN